MSNWYSTIDEARAVLQGQDADDETLAQLIEMASREADRLSRRHFYEWRGTRTFTAESHCNVIIDDLLEAESVDLDADRDGTHGTTLDAADYALAPANAWPKWRLYIIPWASQSAVLPLHEEAVRIQGRWGYGDGQGADPWRALGVTLTTTDADTDTATISKSDILQRGMTIKAGDEQLFVEQLGPSQEDEMIVRRGMNGTTAETHTDTAVKRALYPAHLMHAVRKLVGLGLATTGGQGLISRRIGNYSERFVAPQDQERIEKRLFHRLRRLTVAGIKGKESRYDPV